MGLDYEKPWYGPTIQGKPCNCRPVLDDRGERHAMQCPKWVAEWRRRAVGKDLTERA